MAQKKIQPRKRAPKKRDKIKQKQKQTVIQSVVVKLPDVKRSRKPREVNKKLLSSNQQDLLKLAMFSRNPAPMITILNKEREDATNYNAELSQMKMNQANIQLQLRQLARNQTIDPELKMQKQQALDEESQQFVNNIKNQNQLLKEQNDHLQNMSDISRPMYVDKTRRRPMDFEKKKFKQPTLDQFYQQKDIEQETSLSAIEPELTTLKKVDGGRYDDVIRDIDKLLIQKQLRAKNIANLFDRAGVDRPSVIPKTKTGKLKVLRDLKSDLTLSNF